MYNYNYVLVWFGFHTRGDSWLIVDIPLLNEQVRGVALVMLLLVMSADFMKCLRIIVKMIRVEIFEHKIFRALLRKCLKK